MDDIRMSRLYLCIIGDIWIYPDVTFVPMYYRRMISGCHVCTYVL